MKFLEIKVEGGIVLISLSQIVSITSCGGIKSDNAQSDTEHTYAEIRAAIRDAAGTSKSIVRVAEKSEVWNDSKS